MTHLHAHSHFSLLEATPAPEELIAWATADGTIYNYFDNKPALLLGVFERMKMAILAEGVPDVSGELSLRAFLQAFLYRPLAALAPDDFALFRIVLSEMMVDVELRELYYEEILAPILDLGDRYLQGQAEEHGLHLSPGDAHLMLRLIASTVMGLMLTHIMGDGQVATFT